MKTDEQLLTELTQAAAGLLFMSETDAPFTPVQWPGDAELTPAGLCRLTGHDATTPVETVRLEDFFRAAASEPEWKHAEQLTTARRYQALLQWLGTNLADVRVYRVGQVNIDVYIMGRSANGAWLGLSTRVVET